MALYEPTEHKTYLQIWDSTICQRSKEARDGFERHEKDGRVFYIKRYPGFDGYIDNIEWFDREIEGGKRIKGWNISISDEGDHYQLSMPLNSSATNVFMNCAGNIDFTQKVSFTAWKDREGKTAFLMRQPNRTGDTVKRCHTKDHPNGIPAATFNERRKEWDFTAVEDFLLDKMEKEIIPVCQRHAAARNNGRAMAATAFSDEPEYSGTAEHKAEEEVSIPF